MVSGAHTVVSHADAEALQALLHEVFKLTDVASTDSWHISLLAPAETIAHPSDQQRAPIDMESRPGDIA